MLTPKILTLIGGNDQASVAKSFAPTGFNTIHFYSAAKELTILLPRALKDAINMQIRELGKILTYNGIPYKVVYK